jgi:hypothetical protein
MSKDRLLDYRLKWLRVTRKAYETSYAVTKHLETKFKNEREEVYQLWHELAQEQGQDLGSREVGGVLFSPYEKLRAYFDNEEEFIEWAGQEAAGEYLTTKAKQANLNGLAKRKIANNEPLPPGVKVEYTPQISMRAR